MSYKIFGKPSCGFCQQAKQLLDTLKIPYEYVDLSHNSRLAFRYKAQGYSTVPIVEKEGEVIGGFYELRQDLVENI